MSTTTTEHTLTVGDVARASGVTTSAIRFYERQGLLVSHRTTGNQRRYDEFAPCTVRICRVAQRVGLTVQEIVALLDSVPDHPTEQDWQHFTESLVAEAERGINDLRRTLDDLATDQPLCTLPGTNQN
jgi:MerR family redox-sensitive transcriptional activator SoxR